MLSKLIREFWYDIMKNGRHYFRGKYKHYILCGVK